MPISAKNAALLRLMVQIIRRSFAGTKRQSSSALRRLRRLFLCRSSRVLPPWFVDGRKRRTSSSTSGRINSLDLAAKVSPTSELNSLRAVLALQIDRHEHGERDGKGLTPETQSELQSKFKHLRERLDGLHRFG